LMFVAIHHRQSSGKTPTQNLQPWNNTEIDAAPFPAHTRRMAKKPGAESTAKSPSRKAAAKRTNHFISATSRANNYCQLAIYKSW